VSASIETALRWLESRRAQAEQLVTAMESQVQSALRQNTQQWAFATGGRPEATPGIVRCSGAVTIPETLDLSDSEWGTTTLAWDGGSGTAATWSGSMPATVMGVPMTVAWQLSFNGVGTTPWGLTWTTSGGAASNFGTEHCGPWSAAFQAYVSGFPDGLHGTDAAITVSIP
jgi:hypothetical protein